MKPVGYTTSCTATSPAAGPWVPDTRQAWLDTFAARLPQRRPLAGLDLGSGTGRWTPAPAETFGPMVGVEPSERIPLPARAVDFVIMFLVWHHLRDKVAAAAELARVARPGGRLILRTQFSDRMPRLWWLAHFSRGYEADAGMYDSAGHTTRLLEAAGWRVGAIAEFTSSTKITMRETLERLRLPQPLHLRAVDRGRAHRGLRSAGAGRRQDAGRSRTAEHEVLVGGRTGVSHPVELDLGAGSLILVVEALR